MSLSDDQVRRIARLARIALSAGESDAEVAGLATRLNSVLGLIDQMSAADTAGIEPMAHPLPGLAQRLRPDVVTEKDQHELYQRNAPQTEAALYLVPKVIE